MTIDEAIKILTFLERTSPEGYSADERPTFKLGIEALQRVKYLRLHWDKDLHIPLPGETKD